MYEYKATVIKIVDGDTLDVLVDLGMRITIEQRLRLLGIDTPEIFKPKTKEEKEHGENAKDFVMNLLPVNTVITIKTYKDKTEKYGRYLADVILPNGDNLSELLIKNEFKK